MRLSYFQERVAGGGTTPIFSVLLQQPRQVTPLTARINYEAAKEALGESRRCNPPRDPDDVFPIYSSYGAWSKARRYASRTVMRVLGDATLLLRDYYIVT